MTIFFVIIAAVLIIAAITIFSLFNKLAGKKKTGGGNWLKPQIKWGKPIGMTIVALLAIGAVWFFWSDILGLWADFKGEELVANYWMWGVGALGAAYLLWKERPFLRLVAGWGAAALFLVGMVNYLKDGSFVPKGCDETPIVVQIPKSVVTLKPGCTLVLSKRLIQQHRAEVTGNPDASAGIRATVDTAADPELASIDDTQLFAFGDPYVTGSGVPRQNIIAQPGLKKPVRLVVYDRDTE